MKQANLVETKKIRQIFQTYCDLKQDVQNITQVIVFLKFVSLIIDLALVLFQTLSTAGLAYEDPEVDFEVILSVYWILELILEVCWLLCPVHCLLQRGEIKFLIN